MMEIAKKPSGLPRPVRITPTVRINQILSKTFSIEIPRYFLTNDLGQLPHLAYYLFSKSKLDLADLELKKYKNEIRNF